MLREQISIIKPAMLSLRQRDVYKRQDLYKTKRIRRFEMAYVAESYFGDELSFFCDEANSNEFQANRRCEGNAIQIIETLNQKIDYDSIEVEFNKRRSKSKKFLKRAIG